jgi:hypothetical protein
VGQSVRVYLQRAGGQYEVLDPNGFQPLGLQPLTVSSAVRSLPPGKVTYLLPLEAWIVLSFFAILVWGGAVGSRGLIYFMRDDLDLMLPKAVKTPRTRFSMRWLFAAVSLLALGQAGQRWDSAFIGWMAIAAFSTLIICTVRPPRTAVGRSLRWGVNLLFLSAILAAVAAELG